MKFTINNQFTTKNIILFIYKETTKIEIPQLQIQKELPAIGEKELGEINYFDINEYNLFVASLGEENKLTLPKFKKTLKSVLKTIQSKKLTTCDIISNNLPFKEEELIKNIIHTAIVGLYQFNKYKSEKKDVNIEQINIIIDTTNDYSEIINETISLSENINYTRDLVISNSWEINPESFSKLIKEWAKNYNVKVKILDKKDLEKENMNLHLAVGNGGKWEPKLVILEYMPQKDQDPIALVGKGLCFDSGGYNLKPTNYIEDMKMDMAGAATVFGAFKAIVENKIEKNVICAIGLAENLIGKDAYRPGDVFISRSGKSVEIGNTDAEGRLVLADVLDYIQDKYKIKAIIDLATLTGAITIGLGLHYTGTFSNDKELVDKFIKTSENLDENIWPMPLDEDFEEMMKGTISDLKNVSPYRYGGSSTAAAFLKQFIKENIKWVHFDIAGTAWIQSYDWKIYDKNYPTGLGVALLYNFIKEQEI